MNGQREQEALGLNVGRYTWIGLHRDPKDNTSWLWVDGSKPIFTNWLQNQPDNLKGIEDCVHMYTSGKWNVKNCSHYVHYVCEIFVGKSGTSCSNKTILISNYHLKYKINKTSRKLSKEK